MGNKFQEAIDHDNLEEARNNLRQFKEEIIMAENKRLDELHMRFLEDNEELSFKDMRLIRRVFDFLKKDNDIIMK